MKILMITIGYPPEQQGGTEIYVRGLVEALKQRGHECFVAFVEPFNLPHGPEIQTTSSEHSGTRVDTIQINSAYHKLEFVIFDAALRAKLIGEFHKLINELLPDVIHLHPLQLGFESYLIEALNRDGQKVVVTYHSPTMSCARGDLIYMGSQVCDGLILQDRCTKCLYHWKSVPKPIAASLAKVPLNWYRFAFAKMKNSSMLKKLLSFVSVPLIIEERRNAWTRATSNAKAIVAVCEWVREIIVKNSVAREKVVLSRQGLRLDPAQNGGIRSGTPRFGYLGRISPEKGIQLLIDVLKRIPPEIDYEFEFYSSSFGSSNLRPEEEGLVRAINDLQQRDRRVRVLDNITHLQVLQVLGKWDALVVPSLWPESGPLVVYEAFAAQTPIIGSRLGGIAELVRDGETGFLFTHRKSKELLMLLKQCASEPGGLRRLRQNIPPVRTIAQVADDMLRLYDRLL